jgi:hypothetical protein
MRKLLVDMMSRSRLNVEGIIKNQGKIHVASPHLKKGKYVTNYECNKEQISPHNR